MLKNSIEMNVRIKFGSFTVLVLGLELTLYRVMGMGFMKNFKNGKKFEISSTFRISFESLIYGFWIAKYIFF